jgi:hypothetical protein
MMMVLRQGVVQVFGVWATLHAGGITRTGERRGPGITRMGETRPGTTTSSQEMSPRAAGTLGDVNESQPVDRVVSLTPEQPPEVVRAVSDVLLRDPNEADPWWRAGIEESLGSS